jgi:hypothetical protein
LLSGLVDQRENAGLKWAALGSAKDELSHDGFNLSFPHAASLQGSCRPLASLATMEALPGLLQSQVIPNEIRALLLPKISKSK